MIHVGVMLEVAFSQVGDLTSQTRRPSGGDELAADMRARRPHQRPSRETVRMTYRIGSGRVRRILDTWTRPSIVGQRLGRPVLIHSACVKRARRAHELDAETWHTTTRE